jgi:hypothetical protein
MDKNYNTNIQKNSTLFYTKMVERVLTLVTTKKVEKTIKTTKDFGKFLKIYAEENE